MYAQNLEQSCANTEAKLLLHASEIERIGRRCRPRATRSSLELYFIGGRAKVEIALAKGKQEWDKRRSLREAQDKREAERAMRAYTGELQVAYR